MKYYFALVLCMFCGIFLVKAQIEKTNKKELILGEWEFLRTDHMVHLLVNNEERYYPVQDTLFNKVFYNFMSNNKLIIRRVEFRNNQEDTVRGRDECKWNVNKHGFLKIKRKKWEGGNFSFPLHFVGKDYFYLIVGKNLVTKEYDRKKYVFQRKDRIPSLKDSLNGIWLRNADTLERSMMDTIVYRRAAFLDTNYYNDTIDAFIYNERFELERMQINLEIFESNSMSQFRLIKGYESLSLINKDLNCNLFDFDEGRVISYGFELYQQVVLEGGVLKFHIGNRMILDGVYRAEYLIYNILKISDKELVLVRVKEK